MRVRLLGEKVKRLIYIRLLEAGGFMKFIKLFVLLCMLLPFSAGFAEDVAMVVAGQALAKLDNEVWQVQLAEMLPEKVFLTVGPQEILKLIHLANDKEYDLPPKSQVQISATGIEGTDVAGKSIKLVTSDLDLGAGMGAQTGAAFVGKGRRQLRPSKRKSLIDDLPKAEDLKEMEGVHFESDDFDSNSISEIQPKTSDQKAKTNIYERLSMSARPDAPISAPSEASPLSLSPKPEKKSEQSREDLIVFAIPVETTRQFLKMNNVFEFSSELGLNLISADEKDGWIEFFIAAPASVAEDFAFTFLTADGTHEVRLKPMKFAQARMSDALRLEKQGLFNQAAGTWYELAQKHSISKKILGSHLSRLKGKILGE